MKCLVTGGAGFVGSNLVDRLLRDGHEVAVYDNLSTGHLAFLDGALASGRCVLHKEDVLNVDALKRAMAGQEIVFHVSANADVRGGPDNPRRDLEQNTVATFNVLDAMRHAGVRRIAFSSTSAVYGEPDITPTPEDAPFPIQTSFYGASKASGEALIHAFVAAYGFQGIIFRYVSLLGERYHHGHVIDFIRKLQRDPARMEILGNGQQRKSYLYIQDCVDAMLLAIAKAPAGVSAYNLGRDDSCEVTESIGWICRRLNLNPTLVFGTEKRGWVGDNPLVLLDSSRIKALGWKPRVSIEDAVNRTVDFIMSHPSILKVAR